MPGLTPALTIVPFVVGGTSVLMPVVPLVFAQLGHSTAAASATTAIFMAATVASQLVAPPLLRWLGYRGVILIGALLMGPPSVVMLASPLAEWWYTVAAIRGLGFGLLTVACTSLPAVIAPPRLLARTAAKQGAAMSFTMTAGLSAGLFLNGHLGFAAAVAAACALPMLGCGILLAVPAVREARRNASGGRVTSQRRRQAATITTLIAAGAVWGGLSVLIPIAQATGAASAIVTLTAFGVATIIGRQVSGACAEPGRLRVLTMVAVLVAAIGVAGFAIPQACFETDLAYAWWQYGSAALFGLGFGVVQNDTLVAIFALYDDGGRATGSKWWNLTVDLGMGVGAFGFGAITSTWSMPAAAVCGAVVLLVVAPLGWLVRASFGARQ